ncbi:helix-turn-helix domain-containing protein [Chitinimonas koreensis]|uniref:helix-turn-helix domain-containing protein n=1 Tax=Chitinimonas koreensis TaxID=356302 RepID=UPI00054CF975|nr:helix-turn-helix transcriptional regulator [Chitinimonas koreensis]QNM95457.1 helix-turn-helix transcriptional regulator [Chitinimonas koreensis]
METIGQRVKRFREEQKLTRKALARKAGVTVSTVSNVENGIRSRPRSLNSLALALGKDPYEVEFGSRTVGGDSTQGEREAQPPALLVQIDLLVQSLPEDKAAMVVDTLEELVTLLHGLPADKIEELANATKAMARGLKSAK